MKKILLLLSMLMFIFTATVSAASAVFLKNQWYEPSEGTAEYVRAVSYTHLTLPTTERV